MVVSASFGLMSYVCACSSWDANLFYDSRNIGLHLKNSFKCKADAAGVTTEGVAATALLRIPTVKKKSIRSPTVV
ncbi:unnamed protein product [Victoria cruziana]